MLQLCTGWSARTSKQGLVPPTLLTPRLLLGTWQVNLLLEQMERMEQAEGDECQSPQPEGEDAVLHSDADSVQQQTIATDGQPYPLGGAVPPGAAGDVRGIGCSRSPLSAPVTSNPPQCPPMRSKSLGFEISRVVVLERATCDLQTAFDKLTCENTKQRNDAAQQVMVLLAPDV